MVARLFLLAACLLGSTDALVVGGRGLSTVRQAATPLAPFTIMKSQEDKEFEEVRRPRPSPPSHPPLHRHAHHRPTLLHTSHCASSRTLTLTLTHAPCLSQWARKKKIAAGVDPDEDFAAGREAESKIYVVGGAPAAAAALAACPRTLLPAPPALSRPRPLARCLSVPLPR